MCRLKSLLRIVVQPNVVQILDLLQLLELLVVPNVRIVSRQTHQIVNETQNDQQTRDRSQNEHDLCLFNAILAKRFGGETAAHLHVVLRMIGWKHETCTQSKTMVDRTLCKTQIITRRRRSKKRLRNCDKSMQVCCFSTLSDEHRFQKIVFRNVAMTSEHSIRIHTKFSTYVMPINYSETHTEE